MGIISKAGLIGLVIVATVGFKQAVKTDFIKNNKLNENIKIYVQQSIQDYNSSYNQRVPCSSEFSEWMISAGLATGLAGLSRCYRKKS